jgi:hypothetical protein
VSVDSHLIHTCAIKRPRVERDSYNASKETLYSHLTDQVCRLVTKSERVPMGELAEKPVVTTYLLMLPAYTDVRPGDQIHSLVDEQGTAMAGTFRIDEVLPRRARAQRHISLRLERIRA